MLFNVNIQSRIFAEWNQIRTNKFYLKLLLRFKVKGGEHAFLKIKKNV